MKFYSLTAFALLLSTVSLAQLGEAFPDMDAESLTHQQVNVPSDLKGKYSLIGLAYSKKSEKYLKTWFSPVYNTFIHKPETPSLFVGNYDVNVYFIPMFTGVKRAAYKSTMKKVEAGIDKRLHPHVLFYKGDLKTYKKALKFSGKDVPYFFVLNPQGEVIYTTTGSHSSAKMQKIMDQVDDAWQ
ncbi:MAG: hypothetical protein AAGA85_04410 [Bacteroidota bacterium]